MGLIQMAPGAERPEPPAMTIDPLHGKRFHRVMALRSALRAEGGAARRMLLFYSSFAVSAAR